MKILFGTLYINNLSLKKEMQHFDKDESNNFNALFNAYQGVTDKHKSLYIFIVNKIIVEEVIEKIKSIFF